MVRKFRPMAYPRLLSPRRGSPARGAPATSTGRRCNRPGQGCGRSSRGRQPTVRPKRVGSPSTKAGGGARPHQRVLQTSATLSRGLLQGLKGAPPPPPPPPRGNGGERRRDGGGSLLLRPGTGEGG